MIESFEKYTDSAIMALNRLYEISEDFRCFIDNGCLYENGCLEQELYDEETELFFVLTAGLTKLVIFVNNNNDALEDIEDIVIKFPFLGRSLNYCEKEVKNWVDLRCCDVSDAFCPCAWLGRFHRFDVYAMERVDEVDSYKVETMAYDSAYDYFNCTWPKGEKQSQEDYEGIADSYAQEKSDDPTEWLEEFYPGLREALEDWGINDVHSGNIGFIDGKPVIFDYSGWQG